MANENTHRNITDWLSDLHNVLLVSTLDILGNLNLLIENHRDTNIKSYPNTIYASCTKMKPNQKSLARIKKFFVYSKNTW